LEVRKRKEQEDSENYIMRNLIIVGVIKSIWAGHVAHIMKMRNAYNVLVRKS
jgi:hypothetical protein